jgi:hypothetical protein
MTAVAPEPRLSDFFLSLAGDPSLLEEYERDPRTALAAAGLGDVQIDAVLGGPDAVRSALETELTGDPALRRFVTTPRMSTEGPEEPEPDEPEPDEPEPEPESDDAEDFDFDRLSVA